MTAATATPRRYVRRSLVGVLAALALALAGCSSSPTPDPMSSTTAAPLTTPDAVAAAFAASFAAGDTPTACTLTGGQALQHMTETGWCQRSPGWSTDYWTHDHCQLPADSQYAAMSYYDYRTNTPVDRFTDFVIGVTGAVPDLKVTFLGANPGGTDTCAGHR